MSPPIQVISSFHVFSKLAEILFYAEDLLLTICQWLDAPDPSSNHKEACSKRHAGTGDWFITRDMFAE